MSSAADEDMPAQGPAREADLLGSRIKRGLGWSFLNNIVGRVGTLVSGIVLARMLTPHDYGVFAVALVALQILLSLNDLGITSAIIRWQGDVRKYAETATTLILAISFALFGAFYALAPWLAEVLNVPGATGVLRLLGTSLIIDGVFAVPAALLTRDFLQRQRTIVDFTNLTVTITVSVVLAAHGFGPWSLAWGRIAGNLSSGFLLIVFSPVRVWPGYDRDLARHMTTFGAPLLGSNLLGIAMLNVDYVIVGRMLGPVPLGLYLMAFNLSSWPVNMFSFAVRRVSLAGFARLLAEPVRLRNAFDRALALLMAVTVPVCVLLSAFSFPLIRFVYGSSWSGAATALQFLAVIGLVRVALELAYDVLVALGRTRVVLFLQALWLVALIPGLALGAHLDGIRGVGIGHLAVGLFVVTPAFALALRHEQFSLREMSRGLVRPLVGGLLIVAVAVGVHLTVDGDFPRLAAGGLLALACYGPVVLPMRHLLRTSLKPETAEVSGVLSDADLSTP